MFRSLMYGLPPLVALTALTVFAPPPALATPILQTTDGILTGATGVDVGGTLYDVQFIDGTCAGVFSGCDAVSDFTFTTQQDADNASNALMNQVLLDLSPDQPFDTSPALTQGCTDSTTSCFITTPYTFDSTSIGTVVEISILSNQPGLIPDIISNPGILIPYDLSSIPEATWAAWTPHATVPEPTALVLLTSGLLGLAGYRWRQRRQAGLQIG